MEDITDAGYKHARIVWEDFVIQNPGEYHDLYVQRDLLLLVDVFKSFQSKCVQIYELDPAHFLSAPRLVWEACLKKTIVELDLLIDFDMLLMEEKGIRDGMCHANH